MAIYLANNASHHTNSDFDLVFSVVWHSLASLFPCINKSFPSLNSIKVGVDVEYVINSLIGIEDICF